MKTSNVVIVCVVGTLGGLTSWYSVSLGCVVVVG